ncbi:beclin 1 (plasmid) [Clostridium botulinum]|uniref:Beclin 1 n=1 Tax=Clostridium botulinum (strain 657 / Type Ba4) TaxID=515621 RepID=A0A3F3A646_CLOB6|nr:hypothetical protein [Clostridium botulinum]ACQ51421.1 putative beclin 1 [Clostridium botulinum Ba4 str. 657]AXG90456.1 beclin 1 [Clostridium botulinum]NFM32927.1 beclin 1 [Clostridium botulinum]BDB03794.1 hypothetical protein CBOS2020_38680 [Clostridium botulinum]
MKILYKWVITTKPLRIKKEIIKNVKEKRDGSIMDKGDYCTYDFKENLGKYKINTSYNNSSKIDWIQYISLKDDFDLEKVKEILLQEIEECKKELQLKEDQIKELRLSNE